MRELKTVPWRKLLRSLTLPLLLLLAQQGAVLHELSHYSAALTHDREKQSPAGEVCTLCVAIRHLDSAAAPRPVIAPLKAELSYSAPSSPTEVAQAIELRAPCSRGPPQFL